jgi:hypothetical protein
MSTGRAISTPLRVIAPNALGCAMVIQAPGIIETKVAVAAGIATDLTSTYRLRLRCASLLRSLAMTGKSNALK